MSAFRRLNVRGCGTQLRVTGKGDPILFLRGFDFSFDTTEFTDALSEDFQVVVPDHPGFGESDVSDYGRSVGDLAYFYLSVLDALEVARAHVVGACVGGWLGAEMALRTDTRISSLTLIGPAGVQKRGLGIGDPFIKSPAAASAMMLADTALAERLQQSAGSDEQIDQQLKNRYALARLTWQPRLINPDLARWLHRISVPTQLIWGSEDKLFPPGHSEVWRNEIGGISFHLEEGVGHLPHVERPAAIAGRVKHFIGKCAA